MFSTYRAIVDDEGTIRLLGQVKLKEGAHALATVADRDTLVWLIGSKTQPAQNNSYPKCICGCGNKNNPGSRFNQGHDMPAVGMLRLAYRGEINAGELPDVLIEAARNNPGMLLVHEFTSEDILRIAGKTAAKNAYQAIVDSKSTIRLLNPVKLEEGTHILVTVADGDALMRASGRTALPEERLREELQEDEAWAYLLKDLPS